jgi:TolB-like protein/class 3 adenylate cyclase/tetratricopeptide (TPR) repeat protein
MVAALGGQSVTLFPDHGRKLIAVVYADMVGYSRLIGLDDAGTFERLRELHRDLIDPALLRHRGTLVSTGGDSLLVRFDSIIPAMRFAVDVQRGVPDFDGDYARDNRIRFRMGVNVGDVIPEGSNLHGEGVNIAARLQSVCPPGAICVSRVVRDHVGNRLGLKLEPLGSLTLKNIAHPVEAFALRLDAGVPTEAPLARRRLRHMVLTGYAALLLAGGAGAGWWLHRDFSAPIVSAAPSASALASPDVARAPRLSLVVLPFNNFDNTPELNSVADGITEDLTTSLAQHRGLVVTAPNSAFAFKGKAVDIKRLGTELGVRYAVEGSVRKVGSSLRVTVQLVSTETGAHLWASEINANATAGAPGQDEIAWRMSQEVFRRLVDIESARGARERPGNPDATDILLQAWALHNRPPNSQQWSELIALYERAVQLDPSLPEALAGLATVLLDSLSGFDDPNAAATIDRAAALVTRAESIQPEQFYVMSARGYLLRFEGHGPEAIATFQRIIDLYPVNGSSYHMLATNLLWVGRAAEAVSNEQRAIQLDPHNPYLWIRELRLSEASLFLGQYDEAVAWGQRSLAAHPGGSLWFHAGRYAEIAAAHALAGRTGEAHAAAAEASRLRPTMTVRSWGNEAGPYLANPVFAAQIAHVQEGMRLAGLRDHADEDADFGVVTDDALHTHDEAATPTTAPGARTIRTADLVAFQKQHKLLVLDVSGWGKSIPGAIGLRGGGIGGTTSDPFQARLGRKMEELTHGDRTVPIAAMAWNADRYSGRNLALRLVALGYTDVTWYRGGREAWEVAGQPEAEISAQVW